MCTAVPLEVARPAICSRFRSQGRVPGTCILNLSKIGQSADQLLQINHSSAVRHLEFDGKWILIISRPLGPYSIHI